MLSVLAVALGGAIGAVGRYLMGFIPYEGEFPLATFLVNLIGAFVICFVAEAISSVPSMSPRLGLFLKTGICGGFTTFSTFSLETLSLFESGRYALGTGYAVLSLVACVLGVLLGKMAFKGIVMLQR